MNDTPHPHYAEDFHCIGPDCEESCCEGWGVFVDKATYKKYRARPELRHLTSEHIEVNPEARDTFSHARIKLEPDGRCPFLSQERLCEIHRQHGAGFLSKTCARYPRALVRFDGGIERALHLSCPEAARVVLLNPRLLPEAGGLRYARFKLEDSQNPPDISPPELVRQLRSFALELLQDRSYPLWQRLFLLGIVCGRVHETMAAQEPAKVPQLLAQYASMIVQGNLRPSLEGIPARPGLQLDLVMQLIRRRFQLEQPYRGFAEGVAEFLVGIAHAPEAPLRYSAEAYHAAYARWYRPFEEAHPEFLENYAVNYIFRTRFPFADMPNKMQPAMDALSSSLLLALHWRFLHSLLIGAAGRYKDEFSADHALRVVRAFARGVEHNVRFFDELMTFVRAPELQQADGLAVLLRN